MSELNDMQKIYTNPNGVELLVSGGTDCYIYPEKFAALAKKYNFIKDRRFAYEDESVVDEVRSHLRRGRMVILAGCKDGIDLYLEPLHR